MAIENTSTKVDYVRLTENLNKQKYRKTNTAQAKRTALKRKERKKQEETAERYDRKPYQIIPNGYKIGDLHYSEIVLKLMKNYADLSNINRDLLENLVTEILVNEGWSSDNLYDLWSDGFSSWTKEMKDLGPCKFIFTIIPFSRHKLIGVSAVYKLLHLVLREQAMKGIIYTTNCFTKEALRFIKDNKKKLHYLDSDELKAKIKSQTGVRSN